jgi:hypothetical protein
MKEIRLPIMKGAMSKPKALSMNEYLKFVQFNLKEAFDKKAYAKWKFHSALNNVALAVSLINKLN